MSESGFEELLRLTKVYIKAGKAHELLDVCERHRQHGWFEHGHGKSCVDAIVDEMRKEGTLMHLIKAACFIALFQLMHCQLLEYFF